MQQTINKLVEVVQTDMVDHDQLGYELAVAMAQDKMSYYDAHSKLHHLKHVLDCAEKHISNAAFKELSRDKRQMDVSHMTSRKDQANY